MSNVDTLVQLSPAALLEANIVAGQIRAKLMQDRGLEDLPTISFIESEATIDSSRDNAGKKVITTVNARTEETDLGTSINGVEMHPSDLILETNELIEKARGISEDAVLGFVLMAACGLTLKMLHGTGLQDEPSDEELREVPGFVLNYLKQKKSL